MRLVTVVENGMIVEEEPWEVSEKLRPRIYGCGGDVHSSDRVTEELIGIHRKNLSRSKRPVK